MKTLSLLALGLFLVSTIAQANADPSPGLRIIVIDTEAGNFGESLVRSINPNLPSNNVIPINNPGTLQDGENIATFDGDVYVANVDRITKLNLDSEGVPDPSLTTGNNNEDITNADFVALTGIVIDSNGLAYVSDSSNNKIYTVNLITAHPVGNTPLAIDADFAFIRDIALENNNLYVLDANFDDDKGRIFKIDLTASTTPNGLPALVIYSGDLGTFSLADTRNIAVHTGFVYVSGNFDGTPGVIKIDTNPPNTATMFSDNAGGELSVPNGLAIDPVGDDLYIADDNGNNDVPAIYRINLQSTSKTPILVTTELLSAPAGLTTLTVQESTLHTDLEISKDVDNPAPLPNEHITYTITVTNRGPDLAEDLIVLDNFPLFPPGTVNPFVNPETDQLSYTTEIHDVSTGQITPGVGTCEFLITDHAVRCQSFGSLDVNDFVVITIEGVVDPGAQGTLRNTVTAINEIFSTSTHKDITVTPLIEFSTLSKMASFLGDVVAGESTIDYTIVIDNSNTLGNALNVVVTDSLPSGVTIDQDTVPVECNVTKNPDGSQLVCNYESINNGNSVTIEYTVDVNSDAPNPLINTVTVKCDNCAPDQSDSTNTPVSRLSELSIQKIADKTEVIAGQDYILYTIFVTNDGPSDAENVVITDTLPAGVTLVSSGTSTTCEYDEQTNILTCTIPILPFGKIEEITIEVDVNSNATGTLQNTASVTSNSDETNPTDNSASSVPIEILQLADVTITKLGPETTVAGRIITYEFTVSNIGPSDAKEVLVSDELPEGFTLISSTEPGSLTDPMCQDQAGTVKCQFGTVGAGQTLTKSIQVKIALSVTGDIENSADVTTITEDSNSNNNLSTIHTIVEPPFCGRAETDFDNVITGTPGNDHIKGTNDDDLIFGLGGNDKIHGKNGNDCIIGGDGDDKIWGGKGDDGIEGNAGNDQLHGQQGNDTLIGGDGNDKIFGGQDNDTIDAGTGNDRVHANQGDDTINGGDGNDWIGAGVGNDTVNGGAGNDKIFGRPGNDILNGEAGDDYIHGGQGDDTINGGDGKDKIFGHQGHDTLNGNNGDDYIHGGQGNDSIDGGADTDRCNGAQGNNTIINCEIEDKKMKEEHEENDDDEGESESEENE